MSFPMTFRPEYCFTGLNGISTYRLKASSIVFLVFWIFFGGV